MRAMILAAGRGERMRPLTDSTPKPLLRVGKWRLIEYHLFALEAAGISEVIINVSHLAEQIKDYIGDGSQYKLSVSYSYEESALETGGGIFQALPFFKDEPFVVINGDVWCDYDLSKLPQLHGLAHLVMVPNPPQHPRGDFVLEDGWLSNDGVNRHTFSGIGLYHPKLFSGCEAGVFPLAPLLIKAMSSRQVSGELYLGHWHDIGTPERLKQLDQHLIEKGT